MTGVRHRDDASERPGAMSTGHFTPVTASAIVGGKTAFSFGRVGDGKQSSGKEGTSIHGKTSRNDADVISDDRGPSAAESADARSRLNHISALGAELGSTIVYPAIERGCSRVA